MASQQAYQAYAQQNKGTLVPGQTIAVNKYTVQVERYLSQGGFAHVYLVRTPTPVYNTTHHVLKRIAVANEAMLSEVKREVDIMRVLKGHPNIVHLIDAAWHRLPNNAYEVFILMEYCPGGGIIDMMNRRLRERLTEADILQIFVDVCEGVAFMHNSRPPLLHRDLKVENILQSSPTSYKLCDFGSATTVHRPATNTQEIRALEAELGRHTTMQYRAPEMIDLYSKRPIDEKSDVWALGVLLYKLCYYTTPFEEHGSLAILNVQYRIPPYPVYSSQMNLLIGSMLREHGTQRPTVFELLKHVHHLRGTKSPFAYNVPIQPPLVPRHTQLVPKASASAVPALNSANHTGHRQITSGLRSAPATSGSPPKNSAVQAREKVLEAIAPMRRGRPNQTTEGSSSRRPSPQTHAPSRSMTVSSQQASTPKESNWLDKEEASYNAQAEARAKANALFDEAWGSGSGGRDKGSRQASLGFESDFAEKLWGASNPNTSISTPPKADLKPPSHLQPSVNTVIKPLSHTGNDPMRNGRDKDAFEGLGLMTSVGKPAPTLAEARMLRTGLAIMSTQTNHYGAQKQAETVPQNAAMSRPTPSPRQTYLTPSNGPLQASSRSPTPNPDPWRVSPSSTSPGLTPIPKDGPIESRYPSLEEIDAQFSAASLYPVSAQSEQWMAGQAHTSSGPTPSLPPLPVVNGEDHDRSSGRQTQSSSGTTPSLPPRPAGNGNKEENDRSSRFNVPSAVPTLDPLGKPGKTFEARSKNEWKDSSVGESKVKSSKSQTGSATMRFAMEGMTATQSTSKLQHATKPPAADKHKPSSSPTKSSRPLPQLDWLTGDDITSNPSEKASTGPVVRDTAAKRTSVVIPSSEFRLQDALAAQYDSAPIMQPEEARAPEISPTVARFAQAFPPIDTTAANDDPTHNEPLTDNWSPLVSHQPSLALKKGGKQKEPESASASSADEDGPEDLGGLSTSPKKGNSLRIRRKGRQSSVHELVDLWGGGVSKEKPDPTPTKPTAVSDKPGTRSKPRPTSLMPPARKPSLSGRSVSGSARVSPARVSPINREPSPQKSPLVDSFSPPSSSVTSPGSGRSRPQSMFVFPPPKPSETPRPATLSPPEEEEATPRPARRQTSISNMVNRYEAIGGKVIAPQQIAAPVSRKPSFNRNAVIPSSQAETGRVQVLPTPDKPNTPSSRDEYRPARMTAEPAKERKRAISSGLTKPSVDISRTVAKPRKVSPIEKQDSLPKKTVDVASRSSTKQEAGNNFIFPKRKPTLPSAEEQLAAAASLNISNDDRPSSPERPYQGVGKLIDQWQRKTEQSDGFSRPPAVKRTGLVPTNRG